MNKHITEKEDLNLSRPEEIALGLKETGLTHQAAFKCRCGHKASTGFTFPGQKEGSTTALVRCNFSLCARVFEVTHKDHGEKGAYVKIRELKKDELALRVAC